VSKNGLVPIHDAHYLQVPTYTKEDGHSTKMLFFAMLYKNTAIFLMEKMVHNQYLGTRSHSVYPIELEFSVKRAGRRRWILLCEKVNGVNQRTLYFELEYRHTANVGSE
jgi:hypothetical protein